MKKVMILVIDGCNPKYLTEETAPNIFETAEKTGFSRRFNAQCHLLQM